MRNIDLSKNSGFKIELRFDNIRAPGKRPNYLVYLTKCHQTNKARKSAEINFFQNVRRHNMFYVSFLIPSSISCYIRSIAVNVICNSISQYVRVRVYRFALKIVKH